MNSNKQLDSEKLLYKLIFQFSIYVNGTNKSLDPYLLSISNKIKLGSNYHQLIPELNSLSDALANISSPQKNPGDETIQPSVDPELQQKYFINKLNKLLTATDIPLKFQHQCTQLIKKSKGNLDLNTYKSIVNSSVSILLNIKDATEHESRDIELFLADIPKQLNSLEQQTINATKSNKESIQNRENLSTEIDQHVENIKISSAKTKELSVLQENISIQLYQLNSQLHKHKETEDYRQLETQKQLNLMSQKIQDMELETEILRNNLKEAHDKTIRDPLTGIPNRLAYDERIELEFNRWLRYENPFTIIIWDIDLFKSINDKYGHNAGDKTLVLIAQLIIKNCRKNDFIARYGGEEFVMLLPDTDSTQSFNLAEKIRTTICNSAFNHNGESIKLSISGGISEFSNEDNQDTVFERADKALYLSKESGRNKCSVLNKEDI